MHLAALLAVVGFLGSAMGLASLPDLLRGDDLDWPWAVGVQSVMAFALSLYLGLSVGSFIAARKARRPLRKAGTAPIWTRQR